jgi:hypothetical protein
MLAFIIHKFAIAILHSYEAIGQEQSLFETWTFEEKDFLEEIINSKRIC